MNKWIWSLIPEVMSLVKIILVMQATNASSERAFSALRRVKSYLLTTVSKNHINHFMKYTVHIVVLIRYDNHKELVKELNLKQVNNDFVDKVDRSSPIFGHFFT